MTNDETVIAKLDQIIRMLSEKSAAQRMVDGQREKARMRMAGKRANVREQRQNVREQPQNVREQEGNEEGKGENEKESSPHTPLKGKEREGSQEAKEERHSTDACAREGQPTTTTLDGNPSAVSEPRDGTEAYGSMPPTREQFLRYATHGAVGIRREVAEECYDFLESVDWTDRGGQPIKGWKWFLKRWDINKPVYDRLKDANRIYDCRSTPANRRTAEFDRARCESEERTRRINEAVYKDDFMAKFFAEKEREKKEAAHGQG